MLRVFLLLACVATAFLCVHLLQRSHRQAAVANAVSPSTSTESKLAQTFLWVWERPEDLRELRPLTEGAAVLEGTLHLNQSAMFSPRRQPYVLPAQTQRIAVVRIETGPRFHATPTVLQDAVQSIVKVASSPGVIAVQIDFDARRSERTFYRSLLQSLRSALPALLPLEMTALVSWCDEDDWISDLPVSSAVPMFFRMEPGRARAGHAQRSSASLSEPLCAKSVGISTHEPWPRDTHGKRFYIFADNGWKADLPLLRAMEKQ